MTPIQKELPIGVFDSGIGGLSVLSVLREEFPEEDFVYVGDSANNPVGNRPIEEIKTIATKIAQFLVAQPVKLIVIACNTFSVVALDTLAQHVSVPIVGMAQGIHDALRVKMKGKLKGPLGIMATVATIGSHKHLDAIHSLKPHAKVVEQGCEHLAACIEEGHLNDDELRSCAEAYVKPLLEARVEVAILGCTHYPLVEPVLRELTNHQIRFVDPAWETSDAVGAILYGEDLERESGRIGSMKIYVTSHAERVTPIVQEIFCDTTLRAELVTL